MNCIPKIARLQMILSMFTWYSSTAVVAFSFSSVTTRRCRGHCSRNDATLNQRVPTSQSMPYTNTRSTINRRQNRILSKSTPTITTTGTSLYAFDVLSKIDNFYETAPYTAAFFTCGIKASAADLFAQTRGMTQSENNSNDEDVKVNDSEMILSTQKQIESQERLTSSLLSSQEISMQKPLTDEMNQSKQLEYQRNFAFILYGGLYQGIAQEYLYNHLFPLWFGIGNDMATVFTKVLFDLTVVSPFICIPIAYIVKSIIYRQHWWSDGIAKYVYDLRYNRLLFTYYAIWCPAGICSFGLIPDHYRIAFIAFISFFWLILLSTISSSSKEKEEVTILRSSETS